MERWWRRPRRTSVWFSLVATVVLRGRVVNRFVPSVRPILVATCISSVRSAVVVCPVAEFCRQFRLRSARGRDDASIKFHRPGTVFDESSRLLVGSPLGSSTLRKHSLPWSIRPTDRPTLYMNVSHRRLTRKYARVTSV
ncbi:uncharacterized protein LOC113562885 [Ooceraea biroi]|uniref:uncharacterized protein LOC113562885 n=1 Tax=Ooceraea biroi TaxID=2015173 RepID=UPI000F07E32E|nr:uncharacterized protein LOC113562885 [Ooceraea biroi]